MTVRKSQQDRINTNDNIKSMTYHIVSIFKVNIYLANLQKEIKSKIISNKPVFNWCLFYTVSSLLSVSVSLLSSELSFFLVTGALAPPLPAGGSSACCRRWTRRYGMWWLCRVDILLTILRDWCRLVSSCSCLSKFSFKTYCYTEIYYYINV